MIFIIPEAPNATVLTFELLLTNNPTFNVLLFKSNTPCVNVSVLVAPIVVLSCNCNVPLFTSVALIVIGQSTVIALDVNVSNFLGAKVHALAPAVNVAVEPRLTLPNIVSTELLIVDEQPVKFKFP